MTRYEHDGAEPARAEQSTASAESNELDRPGLTHDPAAERHSRSGRRRAAGIYGTVVTAAILDAGGASVSTAALAVGVLVTLLVYWVAEQYAELLGEQAERGRLPTWARVRAGLGNTWPMVTSAYLPVLALVGARLLHATSFSAANLALVVALVLLVFHGAAAGRAAELHGMQLALVTLIAGVLGLVMILLKDVVLIYLH